MLLPNALMESARSATRLSPINGPSPSHDPLEQWVVLAPEQVSDHLRADALADRCGVLGADALDEHPPHQLLVHAPAQEWDRLGVYVGLVPLLCGSAVHGRLEAVLQVEAMPGDQSRNVLARRTAA